MVRTVKECIANVARFLFQLDKYNGLENGIKMYKMYNQYNAPVYLDSHSDQI